MKKVLLIPLFALLIANISIVPIYALRNTMTLPIRNSIKVILLNPKNELLLMCANDPKTTSADGAYHGRFWFLIGGEIEPGESIPEAALREIAEETGIFPNEIDLGPEVWFGEFDLVLNGVLTHLKQKFIVAKTKKEDVFLATPDQWEQSVIQKLAWFSLDKIKNSTEVIYPVVLVHLPDIISGKYPASPLEIDLAKKPNKKD